MYAARIGSLSSVKYFLNKGADLYYSDSEGYDVLMAAIEWGHIDILKISA